MVLIMLSQIKLMFHVVSKEIFQFNKKFKSATRIWCLVKIQNDSNMEIGQQAYHCSANGKKKLQIDLNLQYSDPVVHRTGICNLENEGNCHQLNLPCKSSIFSLQSSCLMDHTGSYENLCTDSHGNMPKHMNGTLLGVKNHTYSNSITATPGRNLEMFASPLSNYAPRNLVEMHHHLGSYPTNNEVSKPSFIGFGNGYHPNFCPEDVRRTESASAMNLLRLMDHAAWSGKPHFEGHTGLTETNMCFDDLCNESIRSEYGTRRNHPCICSSVESVYPMVWRQPRNSCLPFSATSKN
ncbi:hypothetical protein HPP92_026650 [Vanilla planifolia]|uniref:Uncharacterized protein n=1 Tax=Vanilla planifolia TaxID=51239 RepID=A0A835U6Q5_VANPL|nr:hypothetical protein HPP92_026867 [Vanilla planifolia]KAG0450608.1 hypothetical protein HPP92_026650 [Vanilla planifolia]